MSRVRLLVCSIVLTQSAFALAQQQAPAIGYMHPAGAAAGQTIDVTLGGYDWTPDMQLFVHPGTIKLELAGPPGPVTIPEPPYWFGKKARRAPDPIPREFRARLTIPADTPPGIYRWQAANANGISKSGQFVVSSPGKTGAEIIEVDRRAQPQSVEVLPATINGQVKLVEEVDRYRFRATTNGPVTCRLTARAFGSALNGVLEISDASGRRIADAADTAGNDTAITFAAQAGQEYIASVYDVDFRGDRAYTYRLTIAPGPRVVAAIPSAGKRGETRPVEFVGYGVATGAAKLESITQNVTFPAIAAPAFDVSLTTPHGTALPFPLLLSDGAETIEPTDAAARTLTIPTALTGTLEERFGEDRFRLAGKKGDVWTIAGQAAAIGSPVDISLAVYDGTGKELARSDDVAGTVDAELTFTVPADGDYQIGIEDVSGMSGNRAAIYRLRIQPPKADFELSAPELVPVAVGGKASLALKVTRLGGFKDPIAVTVTGLPAGITVPDNLTVAAGQAALAVELSAAADAAALAASVTVAGEAKIGEQSVKRSTEPFVVASTLKVPFSLDAEGKDDVSKWPRGSTFPGPVLIERDPGFQGEIVLEMHSKQGRVIQGIWGPELTVAPHETRVLYPIFLPEWLETTRTSRMVVNGVAKIPDPKGNLRYVSSKLKTRIGFLPGGAMMKLSSAVTEQPAAPNGRILLPLTIGRTPELNEPAKIELVTDAATSSLFQATSITLNADQSSCEFPIAVQPGAPATGEYELTVRATILQNGTLPVVSETKVLVLMRPAR